MGDFSRREFLATVATAAVVAGFDKSIKADAFEAPDTVPITPINLRWLESKPSNTDGITCTVPWPRGTLAAKQSLSITTGSAEAVPAESWPLGYWPDGSIKWTAHVFPPMAAPAPGFVVSPGNPTPPSTPLTIQETSEAIEIDTGMIFCRVPRTGATVIGKITRQSRITLSNAKLLVLRQDQPAPESDGSFTTESFSSSTSTAIVEHANAVRAVIKLEGTHQNSSNRNVLPFVLRFYFYAGSDQIRIVHTFIYDAEEQKDFLRGIGMRFDVPMTDAIHDRHVRLAGEGIGVFSEAIRTVTGLRRDPGQAVRDKQIAGSATPPLTDWDPRVATHMELIPAWGDFTLTQLSADGFKIRKRTKPGCGWISAGGGKRSSGAGFIGGISGGVSFGIRDFWQKHPAQLDIRNAHTETAQVTLWLWSPDAQPMDLRFYHDGMGEDTYAKQTQGLNITYEDYEPGYASPLGIARTSEMFIKAVGSTPSAESMATFTRSIQKPPMLVCDPASYLNAEIFGGIWTLPDSTTPAKALIEQQLAFYLDQYIKEVDQRSWYGFWDYGDVRHSYDTDRHVWRYDVGGFAWDNSELSTDLWLWYSFLRTGRADVYRMAEAMTRHTGEVDVYHIGPHKGLGTRHGVQHWGDSSKQTRISSAVFRRPFYFLTADERAGDLLRAQLTEDQTWLNNDVTRKLGRPPGPAPTPQAAPWTPLSWGQLAGAWLTEIERTQNTELRDKLLNGMRSIAKIKTGFFSDHTTMDLATGICTPHGNTILIEHLNAMFGLAEVCGELVKTYGHEVPEFADVWALYGDLYSATPAERLKILGTDAKPEAFLDSHSRCLAFAAWHRNDPALARKAWKNWLDGKSTAQRKQSLKLLHLDGPVVLSPIDEAHDMSTNYVAQFSLSAMQNLAWIGDAVDATL